jgi:serine/threonine-protein kinase
VLLLAATALGALVAAGGGAWGLAHRARRLEAEQARAAQERVLGEALARERERQEAAERASRAEQEARDAEAEPLRLAEKLLSDGRAREARAALAPALARQPPTPGAELLLARALHRIPGSEGAALDAFEAAARAPGGLDAPALADLAAILGTGGHSGARAARLLKGAGRPAVPAVLDAVLHGQGAARLRALEVLRALGAEDRIAPEAAYGPLLDSPDCSLRKAAATRLGELGARAALPRLQELARSKHTVRRFFFKREERDCGAAEAEAAIRRIGVDGAASPTASP